MKERKIGIDCKLTAAIQNLSKTNLNYPKK